MVQKAQLLPEMAKPYLIYQWQNTPKKGGHTCFLRKPLNPFNHNNGGSLGTISDDQWDFGVLIIKKVSLQ